MARRNGINRGLLNVWRRDASSLLTRAAAPAFAPVVVDEKDIARPIDFLGGPVADDRRLSTGAGKPIEIEISGAVIRFPAGADIKTLVAVIGGFRRPA